MADIHDYLEWRGDIPFSADPFNEVDNLILAELSYADFEGSVAENGRRTPLKSAHETFFRLHSREEIEKSDNPIYLAPLLMDGMLSGDRFGKTMLSDYISIIDEDRDIQMAAVTFLLSDGSAYISFRGTDNTVVGWKEDLTMSYRPLTGGQAEALKYLNRVGNRIRRPIRVGGHSKGGNFAVYAAAFCDPEVQDRIIAVYSNDGQGFRHEVTETEEYRRIVPKVTSILPDSSVIGLLLTDRAENKIMVESSAKGLLQHDGLTWQVRRNRFVQAEQSDFSRFIRDMQRDWLSKIDDESRESFIDSLFRMIEATGAETFGEISGQKLRSLERIVSEGQNLSRKKQKEFIRVIGELLQSGGQIMKKSLDELRKEAEARINKETEKR